MLGSELKKIRKKMQLTQKKFAKKIFTNTSYISKMENGDIPISPKIEKTLEKSIRKEYIITQTNKVFSREKFLLNMLTGNDVVDDILLNAKWLHSLDNQKISSKKTRSFIEDEKCNNLGLLGESKRYIINLNGLKGTFYVKKEWIK